MVTDMERNRRTRLCFILCGALSLLLGLGVYLLLAEKAYVSRFISGLFARRVSLRGAEGLFLEILRCWGADFFWAFSLCSFWHAIRLPTKRRSLAIALFTVLFGGAFELLQALSLTTGTADLFDLLAYIAAAGTVCILNDFLTKGEKT